MKQIQRYLHITQFTLSFTDGYGSLKGKRLFSFRGCESAHTKHERFEYGKKALFPCLLFLI